MEFDSPRSSPAYNSLLAALREAGHDEIAMRKLLWLVNAHPTLISHLQVFQNLLAHFESQTFHAINLTWASDWIQDVPVWIRLCSWITARRAKLCRLHGLALFDKKVKGTHPHLGHGVERHSMVAAFWSRHESSSHYPPAPDPSVLASLRYFELQAHLLAAYIDSRYKLSSLEFFETYSDRPERPIAPCRTPEVGVAIREFSLSKYAPLAKQLPSCPSTPKFSAELSTLQVRFESLPHTAQDDAERYLIAIRRYFERFQHVLGGGKPLQVSNRIGWGGGGGRARRHGFIHFEGPNGVFMQEPEQASADPDIAFLPGQSVLIDLDAPSSGSTKQSDSNAIEASGLSPAETLEEVFRLYSPSEIKGRIYAAHHRRLSAEASAQTFAFDYQRLTPFEVSEIDRRAIEWISHPQGHQNTVAALLARTMLLIGQPLYQAWSMDCIWQTAPKTEPPDCTKLTLLIEAPSAGDWANAQVLGFCLPAIMPSFKTELNITLCEIDGDSANAFMLPDLFGLGQQLLDYLKTESRLAFDGFGITQDTASRAITNFTASFDDPRITQQKISGFLSALVTAQSGDQSLSWILTADARNSNQPRMHYTRQTAHRLQGAYVRAAKRIQKFMGREAFTLPPTAVTPLEPVGIGTRFVISLSAVEQMISKNICYLENPLPPEPTQNDFRRYHNRYVVYTALFQALETTIRSVTGPHQLFLAWVKNQPGFGPACAALSDKDSNYTDRARVVMIREPLSQQFAFFKRHLSCINHHLKIAGPMLKARGAKTPFFLVKPGGNVVELTPSMLEMALNEYSACDLPSNFHRSFLRTEFVRRNCHIESVDAHVGHANLGESAHSPISSFDYRLHFERIGKVLQEIHDDIGLKPIPSHLMYQRLRGRPS